MTSNLPSRLSWVASESGRGLPDFCEDEVVNFLITEAVVEKAAFERHEAQEDAREQQKRREWQREAQERMKHEAPLGVG